MFLHARITLLYIKEKTRNNLNNPIRIAICAFMHSAQVEMVNNVVFSEPLSAFLSIRLFRTALLFL